MYELRSPEPTAEDRKPAAKREQRYLGHSVHLHGETRGVTRGVCRGRSAPEAAHSAARRVLLARRSTSCILAPTSRRSAATRHERLGQYGPS